MYSQNVWHTFWQQRVGKERRALANHLKQRVPGPQDEQPFKRLSQQKGYQRTPKGSTLARCDSSPMLKQRGVKNQDSTARGNLPFPDDDISVSSGYGRAGAPHPSSVRSHSMDSYAAARDIEFFDNGRHRALASDTLSTASSCVASTALKLEVENLVHAQIDKFVKPLQEQLRGEVKKREEVEEKLRELRLKNDN